MKRKDYRLLLKKITATVLAATMTMSLFMTCDVAGELLNSIQTVFADETEEPESEAPEFEISADPEEVVIEETTSETEAEPTEAVPDIELIEREVKAEGEDVYVSGLMPAEVRVTAERVDVEISGANVIAAYDIKVFDKDGNEWQPFEPLKISVSNMAEDEGAQVIYVPDDLAVSGEPVDIENESIEKIDAVVTEGNVEFEVDHFSVYVIIEHEGGEVVTPRVEFHFISPVAENYEPTNTNGIYYYTSAPYEYNNAADDSQAGNKQVSSIVRDGDKLESIEAPMNTQTTFFYGWYTVDKTSDTVTYNPTNNTHSGTITYSWSVTDPVRVELDKTASVSAVRDSNDSITAINWTVGNASGTCTDVDSDGCAHVYLAPIYSNYYFVNFHIGAVGETTAETLLSRKLIVLGNSNQTEVKISDVQAPSNDPVHVVFIGWQAKLDEQSSEWTLFRTIDSNNNVIIDPGKDGKYITVGAETIDLYPVFVQARYIEFKIGESGNGANYIGPQLVFTSDEAISDEYGLSSLPTTTRNGFAFSGWYIGENGTGRQITDGQGNIINSDFAETLEGTDDVAYEVKNGKLYAYNALEKLELYAKWTPNLTTTYKVVIWKQKVTDSVDATQKTYDYYTHFERDFSYSGNGNSYIVSTTADDRNYATTNPNNDFTGFHLGSYSAAVEVDPQGGTVLNVYYDRNVYTLTFQDNYNVTTGTSGTQYGVINGAYTRIYNRNGQWRTANNNTAPVYSGTRYVISNNSWLTRKTITALSGQDISSQFPIVGDNGVLFNNGERWEPINSSTYNEVVVYINVIPNENINFHLNTSDASTKTINYYVEVLPGETPDITVNGIGYKLNNGKSISVNVNYFTQEDYVEIEGFTQNGSNPAFSGGKIQNVSSVNFYYKRNSYTLKFSANYPSAYSGVEPNPQEFDNIPYELSLDSYSSVPVPEVPSVDYVFDGWYEDASCTVPFDFSTATMPSANKIIYAKWQFVKFAVDIDPNGGIIDSIDYRWFSQSDLETTGLDQTGVSNGYATYFSNDATQTIEPYENLFRPFVEVSEAEAAQMPVGTVYRYVYIYLSGQEGGNGKLPADVRAAVYIKDTVESLDIFYDYYCDRVNEAGSGLTPLPRAQWEATYVSSEKYRELRTGEQYVFLAWYEVVNGERESKPYDFTTPAEHDTKLVAEWRLDGGYSLLYTTEYYADNNDYITANLEDWTDPLDGTSKYSDGATTQAMQEPTSIMVNGKGAEDSDYVDYQFLGWQIVTIETIAGRPRYTPLEPGVYYTAGQELTVKASYSDANMVIHMQAVYQRRDEAYRRPEVVGLTLDASKDAMNEGTGYIDSSISSLPVWTWPGHYWSDGTCIYFGDTQSNTAVHLYKYATTLTESEVTGETLNPAGTNVFKHTEGFTLIGFDLDKPDTDFVPDYPADAVIAVSPGDEHVLYAVWEPAVYMTITNDTDVGPVTFKVSGTDQAIRVVNQATGSFSRITLNPNQNITLADGETIKLVIPYGAGEMLTLSGTNTLGTGYWLSADDKLGITNPTERTLSGTYYHVPNSETFSFTDPGLVTDPEGIVITFTAEKAPHTLILDDNYTGGAKREVTFSETPEGVVYYQNVGTTAYTLPSTSTRIGWELIGWDENKDLDPETQTPTYKTGAWTINDLTAFFASSPDGDKTLYAIWTINVEASTVYVWKDVPEPGDQNEDFTFAVEFGGQFSYNKAEWRILGYQWGALTTETIQASTAQNNSATLSGNYTLKHNQYLKIVTEQNQTSGRPYLKMTVTKWQRNANGTETQLGNASVLSWYWKNEVVDSPASNKYGNFTFKNLSLSVTESDYTTRYDLGLEVAAYTNAELTVNEANRKLNWDDTFAGGTVIFTNTRKTADVMISKVLLPSEAEAENFTFEAELTLPSGENMSYTLDPSTMVIASGADEEHGGVWKIEDVPTGSTLTITERDEDDRFITQINGTKIVNGSAVTDLNSDEKVFSFVITDDTEVVFTNTFRTRNIRLVVIDDDEPANYLDSANFTFPGVFDGTKFSASGTGLVWEGEVYVGQYELTETSMPDHAGVRYTKLQDPVDINVLGGSGLNKVTATVHNEADRVTVTYDSANDIYIITVVNPKMHRVTVKKMIENDYGINSFLFTVTLTDSNGDPIELSHVYGNNGTNSQGKLEFTLVNNQTALLYVPRNTNVQISETVDDRYITTYQVGNNANDLGIEVEGTSTTLSGVTRDRYVLFTNDRQKVNVTVEKTVVGNGGEFTFTAQLKQDYSVVSDYTLTDNGTPDDTSDDIVTDSNGVATFTLSPETDGTEYIVFTVHKGMSINVTEAENRYTTVYAVTSGSDVLTEGNGKTTDFVAARTNITITFTNTEASIAAPTDVKDNSLILSVLMISSTVCLAGVTMQNEWKKKRRAG
ncbi:MAG: InlB B-repeat-containing protein [Clostridiales bacterium]|nr:InlB B-repeat-containing protein [Clostridiales bacterium]